MSDESLTAADAELTVSEASEAPLAIEPPEAEAAVLEAKAPTVAEVQAEAPPAAPIGPRWFSVSTPSQGSAVNILLRGATTDLDANIQAVKERFLFGHGITKTPHDIRVMALPDDYIPRAADIDHDDAIEAELAKRAKEAEAEAAEQNQA